MAEVSISDYLLQVLGSPAWIYEGWKAKSLRNRGVTLPDEIPDNARLVWDDESREYGFDFQEEEEVAEEEEAVELEEPKEDPEQQGELFG